MPRVLFPWLMIALAIGCVLGPLSCGGDSEPDPDPVSCDATLALARTALENELYDHLRMDAPDPDTPDEVDFSLAHQYYHEAYTCDSANPEARFGLALTTLLVLSRDTEVNDAFDEWKAYLDNNTPFEVESGPSRPLGVPITMPGGREAFALPFEVIPHTVLACVTAPLSEAQPRLSEVQRILLEVAVPALNEAITYLDPVIENETYVFLVSPRMQGDEDELTLEVDHTDFLLMRAACRLLVAACNTATAYDISFESYDVPGLLGVLDQETGTGATLRTGGAAMLAAVPALCIGAIDDVDAAMTSLLNETDNQDNDCIKTDPDDFERADIEEWQADYMPHMRQVFTQATTHTDNWDGDLHTPDAPLTMNLKEFFEDPIANLKAFAPTYTVEIDTLGWNTGQEVEDEGTVTIGPITIADAGYYEGQVSLHYSDFHLSDEGPVYPGGSEELQGALLTVAEAYVSVVLRSLPDWSGDASVRTSFSGELAAGEHMIQVHWESDYHLAETFVGIPVIVWEANSYQEWAASFPDPTLSGFLPGTTSALAIFELLGFNPDDWSKELPLDWSDWD